MSSNRLEVAMKPPVAKWWRVPRSHPFGYVVAYDGSHNLTEVETGTGAQTAVWIYLYDCWEP